MTANQQNIFQVVTWLASLSEANLSLVLTIGNDEALFINRNWNEILETAKKSLQKEDTAEFILRTQDKELTTIMGATFYHEAWKPMTPDFLYSIHHLDPKTLEEKPKQANLEFVNIRDAYPDSPIPDGSNDQKDLDPYGDEE